MNMQTNQGPEQNQNQGYSGQSYGGGAPQNGQQPYGQGYPGGNQQPYGQPPYYQNPNDRPYPPQQPGKGLGIAAMICGICSILFIAANMFIAIGCGIAGLVMGIVGRKRNRKDRMALSGIITSSIGIGICVLLFILAIVLVGAAFGAYGMEYFDYYLNSARLAAMGAGVFF